MVAILSSSNLNSSPQHFLEYTVSATMLQPSSGLATTKTCREVQIIHKKQHITRQQIQ